ncbi:uncharacterized protein RAG0_01075 [Rhynchosporium agropyri]|uniref:Uncharacterized protein n=1 Tax=Rhynchosporium agropyri TaxID=914238 RepID=A0A1E1JVT2_9HELO|nr:uncharacterized protein RAG0_01075 [Rhynchosporium agropyri]
MAQVTRPRTIEVKFMYTEEAEAYAEAVKNTRPSMNQYKQREYKYVILDNDTIDTDYKPVKKTRLASTFKIVNTSSNKLVLHAINCETHQYALRCCIHVFKPRSNSCGILFNFAMGFLAFTTQSIILLEAYSLSSTQYLNIFWRLFFQDRQKIPR